MEAPPTLATLAPELQKAIADALDFEDVISFRQVSRDMRAAAEDKFLLFFSEMDHIFSRYGLTRLAEITSRPHLTKKVWYINLLVFDPHAFAGDPPLRQDDDESEHDSDVEYDQEVERLYSAWDQEIVDLTKDDLDVNLLTLVMRNLQACGRKVDFSVGGALVLNLSPGMTTGIADVMLKLDVEEGNEPLEYGFFNGDCSRAMSSLFKAAAVTEFQFRHLNLCEDPNRGTFGPRALAGLCSFSLQGLCRSWESLSSLMIGFANEYERWFITHDFGFKTLITSAKNLKSLFVYDDGTADEETFGDAAFSDINPLGWLSEAFAHHKLRHLRLGGFNARAEQFAKILFDHRQSLGTVELLGNRIQEHECWSRVLQVIAIDLNLDDVNCSGLMRRTRRSYLGEEVTFPDGAYRFRIEQPEAVKAGVTDMLKNGLEYRRPVV